MIGNKQNFHEYLVANNIICNVKDTDGKAVLHNLLALLKRHFTDLDIELATREVLAREELFPTMVAPGFAIPHARIPGLTEPQIAVACIPDGANFGTAVPVKLMILILTPLDDPNMHMQLLSALAVKCSEPNAIESAAFCATPADLIAYFSGQKVEIPDYLTAGDLMQSDVVTLRETDTIQTAIEKFATSQEEELPVLDNAGELRGVISCGDLLSYSLPEHLLWLENLTPIYKLQPFSDMLKTANETKVADVMRDEFLQVPIHVPAVELAKLFLTHKQNSLIIVDDAGNLAGVVKMKDFASRLFWD